LTLDNDFDLPLSKGTKFISLAYGEKKYGEMYAQALDATDYEYGTLRIIQHVSSSIELLRRRNNLSHAHHQEIASLEPKDQDEWLDRAEKERLTVKELRQEIRDAKRKEKVEDLPADKYRVLYADPPWQYGDKLIDGYGSAEHHYPSMSIPELCDLPVKDLAHEDAVLFLWVTAPMALECGPMIEAWGFNYKAQFVWDKCGHNFGHYNSVRHELLYICTRGSCLPDVKTLIDSVVVLEKSAKHSEKPEFFRETIDKLYTKGNRIELFARSSHEGWESWGNEDAA